MAGQRGLIATLSSIGRRLALALCWTFFSVAASLAAPSEVYDIDLHGGSVADALNRLSEQTGVPVVFPYDLVKDRKANPVVGRYKLLDALNALLKDTGLSGGLSEKSVLTVSLANSAARTTGETSVTEDNYKHNTNLRKAAGSRGIAAFFASITAAFSASAQEIGGDSGDGQSQMASVIVTAQKREERLQEVPIPVTVLKTDDLADTGQDRIRDYYASVPGLTARAGIYPGANTLLSIRGVNSGGGPPTVGILIDDVPFGSTYGGHAGTDIPDIDPSDLDHIEVLRGPQGTLYGADSLGGLIKFVTKDPSTSGYSGRIETGTNSVYNGGQPGFNVRGSMNVPVTDTLAVLMSGFRRQDAGYIDNVFSHVRGANEVQSDGARLSALWSPSSTFSLKLAALYQRSSANGPPDSDLLPGLRPLQQSYLAGIGGYVTEDAAYSAVMKAKLAGIDITSVTGFNTFHTDHSLDYSSLWSKYTLPRYGVSGAPIYNIDGTKRFSEELRLSSSIGALEWLLGGYTSHEQERDFQIANAVDPTTLQVVFPGFFQSYYNGDIKFQETAGFIDLTYHFTDAFDVQIGGRETHINDSFPSKTSVFLAPPTFAGAGGQSTNVFTYLLTPRFRLTPDFMAYARFASGYRPAQPNAASVPGEPAQSAPDKTKNYELGVKADLLDRKLSVDASVYYVGFKDIQIVLRTPTGIAYSANGGDAKSEGVELSLTTKPVTGLTIAGWVSYDEAVLTNNFPASSTSYGITGNRLPGTSKWSGNLSFDESFPIGSATGFIGGVASLVGDRIGNFQSTAKRQYYPGYTRTDLHAGIDYNSWMTSLYVTNVTNRLGIIGGGLDATPTYSFTYIQPRTIGLNISKTF